LPTSLVSVGLLRRPFSEIDGLIERLLAGAPRHRRAAA